MSTIDDLRLRADIIKQEEEEGQNTANRVGGFLRDMVDYVDAATSGIIPTPTPPTSVVVSPLYTTGTKIAGISVDGNTSYLWSPDNSYDDTAIWARINSDKSSIQSSLDTLNNLIAQVTALAQREAVRLDGVIADIDSDIKNKMAELEEDAAWIQQMFPEHEVKWMSGWDDKIEAYLQRVGVWARNDGVTRTQWSSITQKVNSLELSVNDVKQTNAGLVSALSASIKQSVDQGVASVKAEAMSSIKKAEDVIQWMYSALNMQASEYSTFAALYSAGKNGMSNAISEIKTEVKQLDDTFVATSSLASKVEDTIAGLYNQADPSSASVNIFTQVKKNKAGVDSNTDSIATIAVHATGDSSEIDIATKFDRWRAGLITSSTLNKSVATLIAQGENDTKAAIQAMVDNGISSITLTADQINAAAKSSLITVDKLNVRTGNDQYPSLKVTGNKSDGTSYVGISATNINITSDDPNGKLTFAAPRVISEGFDSFRIGDEDSGEIKLECGYENNLYLYAGDGDSEVRMRGNLFFEKDSKIYSNASLEFASSDTLFVTTSGNLEIQGKSTSITGTQDMMLETIDIEISASEFHGDVPYTVDSDERLKDIRRELSPNIEDIAKARIVDYVLKAKKESKESLGSIAQDWQSILPNAVTKDKEGYLGLDYSSAALASAVAAAREIVALKKENRLLKERLDRLERLIEEK